MNHPSVDLNKQTFFLNIFFKFNVYKQKYPEIFISQKISYHNPYRNINNIG